MALSKWPDEFPSLGQHSGGMLLPLPASSFSTFINEAGSSGILLLSQRKGLVRGLLFSPPSYSL